MRKRRDIREAELNLIPFIDMFVTLIIFMLVTVVLVRLGGVAVETPATAERSPTEVKEKSTALQLVLDVDQTSILVSPFTQNLEQKVQDLEKKFDIKDLAALKAYLQELKLKSPKFDPSLFHGSAELSYEQVSEILDTVESAGLGVPTVLAIGVFQ